MIPSGIVRYGTLVISLIIVALLAITYFVPYPENLQVNAVIDNTDDGIQIYVYVPYSYINTLHEDMSAEIEFEGYPSSDFGYTTAMVTQIDKSVQYLNGQNFFIVYMKVKNNNDIALFQGMNGTANILISNKSILQKMLRF